VSSEAEKSISHVLTHSRTDPSWPENLSKAWLEDCLKNHDECPRAQSHWVPTRLLKIEQSGEKVRVVHTNLESRISPYLTLSHCWGDAKFPTLTEQSIPQLVRGVATSMLPRSFQEAIRLTVILGTQYIWIDSLCILQDSVDDWRQESSVMGEVYRNALCNLAATGAANATEGLCFERDPSMSAPAIVRSRWDGISNEDWILYDDSIVYPRELLEGPLLSRGWVIQERVLAPRIIHFGSRQLYWQCQHYQACETYPSGLPPSIMNLHSRWLDSNVVQSILNPAPWSSSTREDAVLKLWDNIVGAFCRCDLTREEDKLVAVSGIAKFIQSRYPGLKYFAGMWQKGLPESLLWLVFELKQVNGEPSRRAKLYRAPSWSWASVDGKIFMISRPGDRYTNLCRVVDLQTVPVGADETGQLKGGALTIAGHLITVGTAGGGYPRELIKDRILINGVWNSSWLPPNIDVDEPYDSLHCLPINKVKSIDRHGKEGDMLGCLMLKPTRTKKGEFTRYGTISLYVNDYRINDLMDIRNEEWMEYERVDPKGNGYVITII
jgi:hypothetical protein